MDQDEENNEREDIIPFLIEKGADTGAKNNSGNIPKRRLPSLRYGV